MALRGGERFPIDHGELEVLATPGHARHHLAFFDTALRGVFTGDGAGVRLEHSSHLRPAVPPPDLDLEQLFASLEAMRRTDPKVVLFSHFGPSPDGAADLMRYRTVVEQWRDVALAAAREKADPEFIAGRLKAFDMNAPASRRSHRGGVDHLQLRARRPRVPPVLRDARTPRTGFEVTELNPSERRAAASMLVLARIVYAFNWYNMGAVLFLVGKGFDANPGELGIVLGAFLVGAGIFQVPAGLWAMRRGYRSTSIFALGLMGVFCLASALSPNWEVLALLRFGAGAGAAFFFAPALGLVSSYYPVGSRGPVIGVYNSGFSIGSAVGLFAGALIGEAVGWPWSLAVGRIGLLVLCFGAAVILPPLRRSVSVPDWRTTWQAVGGSSRPATSGPFPSGCAASGPLSTSRPRTSSSSPNRSTRPGRSRSPQGSRPR